jgi:hypothetical protein
MHRERIASELIVHRSRRRLYVTRGEQTLTRRMLFLQPLLDPKRKGDHLPCVHFLSVLS